MTAKNFSLSDILTITTGVMLSDYNGLSLLVHHLLDAPFDSLSGYAIARARGTCRDSLLDQHSFLCDIIYPKKYLPSYARRGAPEEKILLWLAQIIAEYGEYHPIQSIEAYNNQQEDDVRAYLGYYHYAE